MNHLKQQCVPVKSPYVPSLACLTFQKQHAHKTLCLGNWPIVTSQREQLPHVNPQEPGGGFALFSPLIGPLKSSQVLAGS